MTGGQLVCRSSFVGPEVLHPTAQVSVCARVWVCTFVRARMCAQAHTHTHTHTCTGPGASPEASYYVYAEATGNDGKEFFLERTFANQQVDSVTFQYNMYGSCMGTAQRSSLRSTYNRTLFTQNKERKERKIPLVSEIRL